MREANTADAGSAAESMPNVRVYDIPADATAEETARLIESHSEAGYYLVSALPWPGVGARIFSRQPMKTAESETPERKREDAEADALIEKYPKMAAGKLADKLAEHGIVRGAVWVAFRRKKLARRATAANARREA